MLIEYIYEDFVDDYYPVATIVATSPNNIGVSICSEKDRFKKSLGRHIAHERALHNKETEIPNRNILYSSSTENGNMYNWEVVSLKDVIEQKVAKMKKRAAAYFK